MRDINGWIKKQSRKGLLIWNKRNHFLSISIVRIIVPSNVDDKRYAVDSSHPNFNVNSVKFKDRSRAIIYAKSFMKRN